MRNDFESNYLAHHGILGMKWGVKNGPPYPLTGNMHSPSEVQAGYKRSIKGGSNAALYERHRSKYQARMKAKTVDRPKKAEKTSEESKEKKKFHLTDKQKKYIKIGAAVAATALVAYGGYKIAKASKDINMGKKILQAQGFTGLDDMRVTRKMRDEAIEAAVKKDYSQLVRNMSDADLAKEFKRVRDKEYSGAKMFKYQMEEAARSIKGDTSLHKYKTSEYLNQLADEQFKRENLAWEMKNLGPEYLAKNKMMPMQNTGNSDIRKQYNAMLKFGQAKNQADEVARNAENLTKQLQAQRNAQIAQKLPYRMEAAVAKKASAALNKSTASKATKTAVKTAQKEVASRATNTVTSSDISRMKALVRSGEPMSEVADKLGVSPSTVSKYASSSVKKTTEVAKPVANTVKNTATVVKQTTPKPKLTFDAGSKSTFTEKDMQRLLSNSAALANSTKSNPKQFKEIEDYTQELLKKNKKRVG